MNKLDEVYKVLFIHLLAAKVQRLLLDHLPGGQYNSVRSSQLMLALNEILP